MLMLFAYPAGGLAGLFSSGDNEGMKSRWALEESRALVLVYHFHAVGSCTAIPDVRIAARRVLRRLKSKTELDL